MVSFATNLFSGGRVELDYKIDIIFTAEILLVSSKSKNGEANPATLGYNFLDKKISGDIGLQGRLRGEIVIKFGIKLRGKIKQVKGTVSDKTKKELEDRGEVGIEAGAHSEIRLTLGTSFGKGDNFDTDFYFSGVSVYATFNAKIKKPGKSKTFEIIPSYTKTFNVLKNKGEVK